MSTATIIQVTTPTAATGIDIDHNNNDDDYDDDNMEDAIPERKTKMSRAVADRNSNIFEETAR